MKMHHCDKTILKNSWDDRFHKNLFKWSGKNLKKKKSYNFQESLMTKFLEFFWPVMHHCWVPLLIMWTDGRLISVGRDQKDESKSPEEYSRLRKQDYLLLNWNDPYLSLSNIKTYIVVLEVVWHMKNPIRFCKSYNWMWSWIRDE